MVNLDDVTVGYVCADIAARISCERSLDREEEFLQTRTQSTSDPYSYTFGTIGTNDVVICDSVQPDTTDVTVSMIRSFPYLKLLLLVSSKAGAVPGDSGQVRVGDVVVPPRAVITSGMNGDYKRTDLDLSTGVETGQSWELGDDITTLIAKNDRWGPKCRRPVGDDVNELNKMFVRQHQHVSLAHHDGVVISVGRFPECAVDRDSIAVPLNLGPIACFDQGETMSFLRREADIRRISVLGVSHYCDEKKEDWRRVWEKYASMAAAACAKRIVLGQDTRREENGNQDLAKEEGMALSAL